MARPARFDERVILAAALAVVADHGLSGLTIDAVAARMGGHVGSIYYRFPSKSHLLARLWIDSARAGQEGLLRSLGLSEIETAFERAALHYPRWARRNPAHAQILAAYGREQLLRDVPDELVAELESVNEQLSDAIDEFAARWFGDPRKDYRRAVTFALLDLPASAIRRYLLAGKRPPRSLEPVILAAARAALTAAEP